MKILGCVVIGLVATLGASAETNFAFRARLDAVHAPQLDRAAPPCGADETPIDATWRIAVSSENATVLHAADDLRDYFRVSMGVNLALGCADGGVRTISLGVAAETNALTARVTVTTDRIRLTGATPREVFQASCRLEDELNGRGRPVAKRGSRTYTRLFSPRMTHSGYAVETFPDAYLDQLAHQGMDAILVFIEDPPDVTRNGKVDMPALVRRAAARGIDVWAYASFPEKASKMHPLDPGAEAWYEATYGAIVRNCPALKGLICVGESCGFPSRDPGMGGFWFQPGWQKLGTKLNGFWPVSDWPDWVNLVKKVTRRHRRDFEIVFWTYNWFKKPAEIRLPLLENLPTDITLLVTWVRGDKPTLKCGVPSFVTDYSITAPGPSAVFRSEADVAVRRGMPVMTISNTGGRTWDSGVAPYVPTPGRWKARFDSLKAGQATWGLRALMESHHYGFQPNFISFLAKRAFTAEIPSAAYSNDLQALAVRLFGPRAAPAALSAWASWDAAFEWHQVGDRDFWGPLRVGPAYPLYRPDEAFPQRPGITWKYMMAKFDCPQETLAGEIERGRREIELLRAGVETLGAALADVPPARRDEAKRLWGVGAFYLHSVRTLNNAYRFFRACKANDAAARRAVIEDERRNVTETIPLVEFDSALGWEATMGYVCDPAALAWKLQQLENLTR